MDDIILMCSLGTRLRGCNLRFLLLQMVTFCLGTSDA